ncbi:MAG: CPXCG motif-containing cysteine-rich protein [Pseudomonadota bacterium]
MSWEALGVTEVANHCPYCGEPVQLIVDASAGLQSYVEDCQVCCRPMVVEMVSLSPTVVRLRHEDDA